MIANKALDLYYKPEEETTTKTDDEPTTEPETEIPACGFVG